MGPIESFGLPSVMLNIQREQSIIVMYSSIVIFMMLVIFLSVFAAEIYRTSDRCAR